MNNKIFVIMLLIVCITVMCFAFTGGVFATEINSDSVYNFNQQISSLNFTYSDLGVSLDGTGYYVSASGYKTDVGEITYNILSSSLMQSDHVFYFLVNSSKEYFGVQVSQNLKWVNYYDSFICTGLSSTEVYSVVFPEYVGNIDANCYYGVIDLTQMFGSGNEPSLEQCKQIFTSEYYNYTTGTPLSLSGINAYQQGVSDTLNSYNVVTSPVLTLLRSFTVNVPDCSNAILYSDSSNGDIRFIGGLGLPFSTTLPSTTTVTIYFDSLTVVNVSYYDYLAFGYYLDSVFVPLYSFDLSDSHLSSNGSWTYSDGVIDIVLPVSVDYLVLCAFYPSTSSPNIQNGFTKLVNCYFSYKTFNNQVLINGAYDTGYNNGLSDGKNQGYQNGYTAGLADGTNNDYSFLGLISAVIEAPVNVLIGEYDSSTGLRVGGLLNFEFLGYNMSTLLMSLFSLGVVICIIRLFI